MRFEGSFSQGKLSATANRLYITNCGTMASLSDGGMFRQSAKLKGKGKETNKVVPKPLPPPVSSAEYFRTKNMEASTYSDAQSLSANGAHSSKEEDHFGFLYSMSEKDFH